MPAARSPRPSSRGDPPHVAQAFLPVFRTPPNNPPVPHETTEAVPPQPETPPAHAPLHAPTRPPDSAANEFAGLRCTQPPIRVLQWHCEKCPRRDTPAL